MFSPKYLKIYYGPNEVLYHTFIHRPQYLYALRDALRRLQYRVDLVPVHIINYCMIEMSGVKVFKFNINGLAFNLSSKCDPVMQRAVEAVLAATKMQERAENYHLLLKALENQIFKTIDFKFPKGWYPSKLIPVQEKTSFDECIECSRDMDCCSGLCLFRQEFN